MIKAANVEYIGEIIETDKGQFLRVAWALLVRIYWQASKIQEKQRGRRQLAIDVVFFRVRSSVVMTRQIWALNAIRPKKQPCFHRIDLRIAKQKTLG
jgi:hypothetical protein